VQSSRVHAAGFIGSDFQKKTVEDTPLGRIGQPEDIATIAAFLASDDAYWVNGQTISAAGGARL
jgi:3-oxoacyl-[acyl-carrier protein] reductase